MPGWKRRRPGPDSLSRPGREKMKREMLSKMVQAVMEDNFSLIFGLETKSLFSKLSLFYSPVHRLSYNFPRRPSFFYPFAGFLFPL
jgi:hypothetical protein